MKATKKDDAGRRYVVLRDFGGHVAGDVMTVDPASAADLVRDGMIAEQED